MDSFYVPLQLDVLEEVFKEILVVQGREEMAVPARPIMAFQKQSASYNHRWSWRTSFKGG